MLSYLNLKMTNHNNKRAAKSATKSTTKSSLNSSPPSTPRASPSKAKCPSMKRVSSFIQISQDRLKEMRHSFRTMANLIDCLYSQEKNNFVQLMLAKYDSSQEYRDGWKEQNKHYSERDLRVLFVSALRWHYDSKMDQ